MQDQATTAEYFDDYGDYPVEQEFEQEEYPYQTKVEEPATPKRITIIRAWMLSVSAIAIEFFQWLLTALAIGVVLSPIISFMALIGFWIMFKICDVSFVASPKKLALTGTCGIIELIPVIDLLPALTAAVIGTIVLTMIEDSNNPLAKVANRVSGMVPKIGGKM